MNKWYDAVANRAGLKCEYCLAPSVFFNHRLEVEHIIPESENGPSLIENLALSCRACNSFKSDSTVGLDAVTQDWVTLFNPRTDRWEQHFLLDSGGQISGLTSKGRATVAQLRFNGKMQLDARRLWMRAGVYPPPGNE